MKNVRLLSLVAFTYALANGFVALATPQAGLLYGMSSGDIGLLGAGSPIGYALGCVGLGQLFRNLCGKRVILGGVLVSTLSIVSLSLSHTVWPAFLSQIVYGIAQGAVWPFISAWMLESESPEISRTRVFRFYNAGWTSGSASGMLIAGFLCDHSVIVGCFIVGAVINALTCIGPLLAAPPRAHHEVPEPDPTGIEVAATNERIGFAIFLAAVLANIAALSTRMIESFNYPELNRALGFSPNRMGVYGAVCLGGQLVAFVFGAVYEPLLGSRRLYAAMAGMLVASSLAFAWVESFPVLVGAALLTGFVLAMAFQAAMLAATEWFTNKRNGTTVHEGLVGFAQTMTLAAGFVVQGAKNSGMATRDALQFPFLYILPVGLGLFLLIQMVAVSTSRSRRRLLPAHASDRAPRVIVSDAVVKSQAPGVRTESAVGRQ